MMCKRGRINSKHTLLCQLRSSTRQHSFYLSFVFHRQLRGIDINTCDTGIFCSSDLQSWMHHIRYQGVWGQQFRVRSGSDTIVCVVSLLTQYNTEWLMSPSHLSQVSPWYASIGIAFRKSINAPLVFENLISVNWLPSVPLVSAVAYRRLMNNFKFVS